MGPEIFKYVLLAAFVALTFWLSWVGMQKAKGLRGFAIGNKDMSPILVGITMASSTASTSLFVINPGFVYAHGLSAYLHFAAAAFGSFAALLLLTKKFRISGDKLGSITIPGWIYDRYKNRGLSLFFAFTSLLMVTFVVLILVGSSYILAAQFPISQKAALVCCLFFVFSYVLMGGVYAHAYTNAFQGIMMFVIAIFLFAQGWKYFDGDIFGSLASVGRHYASVYNPDSVLYTNFFSVFVASFMVTFALMLQPHILTKVLYLKDDKQVSTFIWTTVIIGTGYTLILFLGFYAQLSGVEALSQDLVIPTYLYQEFSTGTFGPYISAIVSVTLLAAGLSTLDGVLVSLSAMVVNDIYRPLAKPDTSQESARRDLMVSRLVLVCVGLIALVIAWGQSGESNLVGIFAMQGVYGLAAASLVPILFGVFGPKDIPVATIFACAVVGLVGHLYLNLSGRVYNPAVSSAYAMIMSIGVYAVSFLYCRFTRSPQPA